VSVPVALVGSVTLPLFGALVATLWPRQGGPIAIVVVVGMLLALLSLLVGATTVTQIDLGDWPAPLGIVLAADGLALAFLSMTLAVMAAVVMIGRAEFTHPRPAAAFWPLAMLLWAALNAVYLSRDLFNLYVGLELLTIAAVALVALGGKAEALAAAMRYMLFALTGSLLYLLGVVLVYAAHGALDIGLIAANGPQPTDGPALALMTAGLAAKTALFPLHAWLPPAHAGAPAPASAILSALVPKASFVILLRLWFEAMPQVPGQGALIVLGALGAAAVIHGSLMALRQDRLKLIVAYSTVAQIGYLFLVFHLAGGTASVAPWAAGAWTGAMFQALSHGLAKAAMFLCAGIWIWAVGSDHLDHLRGVGRATPMTTFAFALAAVTLMGLPPSGGFTAKYLMLTAAFAAGHLLWAVVMVGGGLLAAAYLYRPLAILFARDLPEVAPVPRALQAVPLLLAGASVLLGIFSDAPFGLLQLGRPDAAAEGL
jgi:formate hydrogenlyase subunit 3/multisubunit Na+/H+ antiporter MnhD subunit